MEKGLPVDYTSEFEYSDGHSEFIETSHGNSNTPDKKEVYKKPKTITGTLVNSMKKDLYEKDYIKYQSNSYRAHLMSMDKFGRHKKLVHDYLVFQSNTKPEVKTEEKQDKEDVIKENQRFIWHEGDELDSWGSRLAKKYWNRLFKEYVLIDLSRFEQNKYGMRWRLEKEVVAGKGQFICGSDSCELSTDLRSWEVKFNYVEKGERRTALVKVRLCPDCSIKLNFHYQRKEVTKRAKKRRLVSPAPLDDEVMDRDAISNNSNIEEIRNTVKRARRESSRSLTEDEDDGDGDSNSGISNTSCNSHDQQHQLPQNSSSGSAGNGNGPLTVVLDTTTPLVSSGTSSPVSVSSLSEDEAVMNTVALASVVPNPVKRSSSERQQDEFDRYIEDLLL